VRGEKSVCAAVEKKTYVTMVKKTSDLDALTIRSWARLIRTSQSLLIRVEQDLKSHLLPALVWYDVLLELDRAGKPGLRPFQLQKEMLLTQYNLSRLIERMEKAELVKRTAAFDDGRGHIIHITPSGRGKMKQMWRVYQGAIQRHFARHLDQKDVKDLMRISGKLDCSDAGA